MSTLSPSTAPLTHTPTSWSHIFPMCQSYMTRLWGKWRGMNLVKKTAILLHWRLSTKLSYRGGETRGADKEESKHRLTLQGEKCSPSASFSNPLPVSSPPLTRVFCQSLFLLIDLEDRFKLRTIQDREVLWFLIPAKHFLRRVEEEEGVCVRPNVWLCVC